MLILMRSLGLMLVLCGLHLSAHACSFKQRATEAIVDDSKVIFIARIFEVSEVANRPRDADNWTNPPVRAQFRVFDSLKGNPSEVQFLRSGYGGGDCGVPFIVGRRYLVFTDIDGRVRISSGTGDITPEYEPHAKFIAAIKRYISDGTKIP
jgi:hypothetical protein